jgi:hypothetical protein
VEEAPDQAMMRGGLGGAEAPDPATVERAAQCAASGVRCLGIVVKAEPRLGPAGCLSSPIIRSDQDLAQAGESLAANGIPTSSRMGSQVACTKPGSERQRTDFEHQSLGVAPADRCGNKQVFQAALRS